MVQAKLSQRAAQSMRDAAASIKLQVQAESSMLTTHASLATELQQAEAIAKVWSAVKHLLFYVYTYHASILRQGPGDLLRDAWCLRHALKPMS